MTIDVVVPAVGESVQEGMVYKWHKNSGEYVELDDVIVELETDKATVEIVAEAAGVIQTLKAEGETVQVGDVLAKIDTDAAKPAGGAAPVASAPAAAAAPAPVAPAPAVAQAAPAPAAAKPLSPAVGRMVAEHNLAPAAIPATGPGGRVTKTDVVNFMEQGNAAPAAAPAPAPAAAPVAQPRPAGERGVRREPMSMLRRRIAERLLDAQKTNAILTTFNEIDMGALMDMRKQYKEAFKEKYDVGLGFMSFFVKAAVHALKEIPAVNGKIEGTDIVYHDYYDIGVAVSTKRGLMVPVVRDCDQLTFAGVEQTILNYALRGREGKISMEDLAGGTFTISNGGTFGSLMSTPIINPPQSAILGMHKIEKRAVVNDKGDVVVRPMMYVALSYDHRIIDGKEAVTFLVKLKDMIEDPQRLLIEV